MRRLQYLVVEVGRCVNCGRDAGRHSIEGICNPHKVPHPRNGSTPEQCYRSARAYAFVDLDSPQDPGLEPLI